MCMFHVRTFALLGVLCFALSALYAQTNQTTVPVPVAQPDQKPTPTAQPATTTTPPSVTPTLPVQARRPSLMIKRGKTELEWRTSYSHSSRNTIFIDGIAVAPVFAIGQLGVERIRRDIISSSISGRYGIADNLLGELKVPFRYEYDRFSVPELDIQQEHTQSGAGLGDIEAGLYYQLPRKSEESIRWVTSASAKSATGKDAFQIDQGNDVALGTGFWNTKIGITGVKIADPAAVYWSFGYTFNYERDNIRMVTVDPTTEEETISFVSIKPGNTFDVGAGFAYAINNRLSVNTGMSISLSGSTSKDGMEVANTAITSATLRLGAVWLTDNFKPVDIGLSIGLTEDSPDFSLEYKQSFKL